MKVGSHTFDYRRLATGAFGVAQAKGKTSSGRDNAAMEVLSSLIDFIVHVDLHLAEFVRAYGAWVYVLLFAIVFTETGVVVMPFLPGDSLLFVVGALAGAGLIDLPLALGVLMAAAAIGDQCNYSIGRYFGPRVFGWQNSRWFNREAFGRAHAFYERWGGFTLIMGRFFPFARTFAPFVAGVAAMTRHRFTAFSVIGAIAWVGSLGLAGFWFGNLPFVKTHLDKFIWATLILPGLFAIVGSVRSSRRAQRLSSE